MRSGTRGQGHAFPSKRATVCIHVQRPARWVALRQGQMMRARAADRARADARARSDVDPTHMAAPTGKLVADSKPLAFGRNANMVMLISPLAPPAEKWLLS
jgi:hypothetical protein